VWITKSVNLIYVLEAIRVNDSEEPITSSDATKRDLATLSIFGGVARNAHCNSVTNRDQQCTDWRAE
jgi:hypothetical protein